MDSEWKQALLASSRNDNKQHIKNLVSLDNWTINAEKLTTFNYSCISLLTRIFRQLPFVLAHTVQSPSLETSRRRLNADYTLGVNKEK